MSGGQGAVLEPGTDTGNTETQGPGQLAQLQKRFHPSSARPLMFVLTASRGLHLPERSLARRRPLPSP